MNRPIIWISLAIISMAAILLAWRDSPYLKEYKLLRASGELLVDPGWGPEGKLRQRNPANGNYLWGGTELTKRFEAAFETERKTTRRRFTFGPCKSEIWYQGAYDPDLARQEMHRRFGPLPENCSDFTGTYSCAYYDDDITENIEFGLSRQVWDRWLPELAARYRKSTGTEGVVVQQENLYVDYGPSSGSISLEFKNDHVLFTRRVLD